MSPDFTPTRARPIPSIRCTQTNRSTGEQCGRWALRGAIVCIKHGGRLPTVRENSLARVEAARVELVESADAAVEVLKRLMEPGTADGIRLKAATEVLDRAGVRGGPEVAVEVSTKPDAAKIVSDRLKQLASRTRAVEEREREAAEAEDLGIIDAEVVPDPPGNAEQPGLF